MRKVASKEEARAAVALEQARDEAARLLLAYAQAALKVREIEKAARGSGPLILEEHVAQAYTPETLAERWLCSERHIRKLIASGEIPYFHVGGKLLRIKAEDVALFELRNVIPTRPA